MLAMRMVLAIVALAGFVTAAAGQTAPAAPADDMGPLVPLGAGHALPPYLKASDNTLGDEAGVVEGVLTTRDADLIDRDFTLDCLYTIPDRNEREVTIGLGERDGRVAAAFKNSVYLYMQGKRGNTASR